MALIPRLTLRSFAIFFVILAILLTMLAFSMYWASLVIEKSDRSDIADQLFPYSISLHTELNRRLGRVAGLAAFMKSHHDPMEYEAMFQPFAAGLYSREIGVRNFQVVMGTTTTYVYPLEGNSQMIGMDWLKTSGSNLKYLQKAIAIKQPTIIGPFEAHPGTWVIAAVEPVNNSDGSLYGLAAGVYDYQKVVSNISLNHAATTLDLAVRTGDNKITYGKASVFKKKPVINKISVGDSDWEMAAIPKNGWAAQRNRRLLPMILAGLVISFLIAILLSIGIDVNRYLAKAVNKRTKDLNETILELIKTNRLYSTLSKINEQIVRADQVKALLGEISRILVDEGGFRMSWIGLIDKESQRVIPVGVAGSAEDYLKDLKIIVPDNPAGHGPKARALLAKKTFVCNDVEEDPEMAPWRELSRQHGYRSEASFPLIVGKELIGSLNVYSEEKGMFTEKEVRLLIEISEDIGYAIDALEKEKAKRAAEVAVEHAATFPRNNPNPVLEFDKNGKVAFANDAARNALIAIGVDDDLKKYLPADFKNILKMINTENPPATVSREVSIKDRIFGEVIHLAGQFGTIRIYATDITDKLKNETLLAQQREELERSYAIIKRSLDGTVKAIATVAEHKDPYTAGHERRVVDLACAIGRELGLTADNLEGLRIAATLHDIGKIYIPAEILSKPGKLNALEFNMIKVHPKYSYEILSKIDFPWPIAEIALQHHERIDGSGYPDGLKGKDICMEAKILAVADVIEAMASHRPYRPALLLSDALDEINKGKGKLYDGKVAEAAIKVFKNGYNFS